ncbi:transposase [Paraferrimonas haliotis]|uniref:transposase n=1 Tax=Paraferrimonas haliotis TaxID=2013866 RepID=UPI000BA93691|nr:transposase [Paraferrimonas haliotis]
MPRIAREVSPGLPMHITQRCVDKKTCFHRHFDRTLYLDWLKAYALEHGCLVHGYVLMTNHVHLLLTPIGKDSLWKTMKALNQKYAQYYNAYYNRTGAFWQGRYHSRIVEDDAYFLCCLRYIELNPMRANMVSHPSHYVWSSYRYHALGDKDNGLLTKHILYKELGRDDDERQSMYAKLCNQTLSATQIEQVCVHWRP